MKKAIYLQLAAAMVAMLNISLTSCSDDDEKNESSVGSNNALVNDGQKLLTSIDMKEGNSTTTYRYEYDNKLRPYMCVEEEEHYEDNDILFIMDYSKGVMSMDDGIDYAVSFNSKGYITKMKGDWDYTEDGVRYYGKNEFSCSYDKDGHIIEISRTGEDHGDEYESGSHNSKTTYSWENGNLVSSTTVSTWYSEEGDVAEQEEYVQNWTYGTQKNKFKQYPAEFGISDVTVGLLGIGPDMLPLSAEENETFIYEGGTDVYRYSYNATFTLNEDGSISTEKWIHSDGWECEYTFNYTKTDSYSPAESNVYRVQPTRSIVTDSDKAKRTRAFFRSLRSNHRKGKQIK